VGGRATQVVSTELTRLRQTERWIAWVRILAVPFAVVEVGFLSTDYPPGYERWAWLITAVLGVGALAIWFLARRDFGLAGQKTLGLAALALDTAVVASFVVLYYAFEPDTPVRQIMMVPVVEGAIRYGVLGGVLLPVILAPFLAWGEVLRSDRYNRDFSLDAITLPLGVEILVGMIVGWLATRLRREAETAETRAAEAEELRDRLGRRADQLEAVNRVSRALGSSLDQDRALSRFLPEVSNVFEFDRLAIVLVEGDDALVMANAGRAHDSLFPRGTTRPIAGSVVQDVLANGQTVVRGDMAENPRYPEERELAALGLESRVVAPLTLGGEILGILSVCREEPDAYSEDEVELTALLARQLAAAVQNIRMYTAERNAAEELRRLSALRADFVSLVSHELRAPMAAVIGCASTLRARWRELSGDQRESFLALIEQETGRLSNLLGDVLDTSRIEAGTFSYTFGDVDVGDLVRETASMIELATDEITVASHIVEPLPTVRGDRDRLRQLLLNLLSNAAKYTVSGDTIELRAGAEDSSVVLSVEDHGPGIAADQQRLVFEKFGRVNSGGRSKPGAGLGLFIARSIAEAHGGTLDVRSDPGAGATFTVRLPVAGSG
jgi:signal transduction histidine kinase